MMQYEHEIICKGDEPVFIKKLHQQVIRLVGPAAALSVCADRTAIRADGRSVAQLEIALLDANGIVVPDQDVPVRLTLENGELLGMDNGLANDRSLYRSGERTTCRGLAFAVIRVPREKGSIRVKAETEGLNPVTVEIAVE